jgi:hypothetical protein
LQKGWIKPAVADMLVKGYFVIVIASVSQRSNLLKSMRLLRQKAPRNDSHSHPKRIYNKIDLARFKEAIKAILQKYVEYVAKRGDRAFDTKPLKEGAWHYSLDGFINLIAGDDL